MTERFGHAFASHMVARQTAKQGEIPMRKMILTALSTAIILGAFGAGSVALASERDDTGGGYRIGPLGQVFGTPTVSTGQHAYGFVPSVHSKQPAHKKTSNAGAGNAYGLVPSARHNTGSD
jgi:hypothetical protein